MAKYVNLIAFLQKSISKEHVVVIMEFPDWVQVKKMCYVSHELSSLYFLMLEVFQKCSLFTVGSISLVDLKFSWVSLMHLSIH